METYKCGEVITKDIIQHEEWYHDYTVVAEIMNVGPEQAEFFEELPNGFELVLTAVTNYFNKFPSKNLDKDRLTRWIKSLWMTEEDIQKIKSIKDDTMSKDEIQRQFELLNKFNT